MSLPIHGLGNMKLHQFSRVCWLWSDDESSSHGLTHSEYKRSRPSDPMLTNSGSIETCFNMDDIRVSNTSSGNSHHVTTAFRLESFIRSESCPTVPLVSTHLKKDSLQDECHPGGTRWNPTQEQIRVLEMLYRGGMRTPNTHQIEQFTAQLSKYGKIEGKNVFYWFQNHKARERQKQKRNNLGLTRSHRLSPSSTMINSISGKVVEENPYKKCRSWSYECLDQKDDKTLELFPLHPEGKSRWS